MQKRIPDAARNGIIDKLIWIGQIDGGIGSYRQFFERVYPEAANIFYQRGETLLMAIGRHCDSFPGDWENENGMFRQVGILEWTDDQFLYFCREYVNPVFIRKKYDDAREEWIDLQPECVSAINLFLKDCGYELKETAKYGDKVEYDIFELSGVKGKIQGIVFAAVAKPSFILTDVLNQDVEIPADPEKYLCYDKDIRPEGLLWKDLKDWYSCSCLESEKSLLSRLWESVCHCKSPIEKTFFSTYLELVDELGDTIPALLPQVYLYFDSKSQKERTIQIFDHQCMDFLMILSQRKRVVIELDGAQHYADSQKINMHGRECSVCIASPAKYASMVKAQREMTLAGYEVYRFGGKELMESDAREVIRQFFTELFQKHAVVLSE